MSYKTISWTIKDAAVIDVLQPHCNYGTSPQEYLRRVLADAGLVREKATRMVSQVNFPSVGMGEQLKLSLYSEDHAMLKAKAVESGITIQELIKQVLLAF